MDNDQNIRLITEKEVRYLLGGIGARVLNNLIYGSEFPLPIELSPRKHRWNLQQVNEWIRNTSRKKNDTR